MSERILVLVRHGQSEWNLKNLFTGWRDVGLTEVGIGEARAAGKKLKAQGLHFDVGFTSALVRAQRSLDLVLDEMGQKNIPVIKNLALNERDYGDLSGLNKDDARAKWGEEQVHIWRRSYDVPPPGGEVAAGYRRTRAALLHPGNPAARARRQQCAGRRPRQFAARAGDGARKATPEQILEREIGTGVPLIYRLNAEFHGRPRSRIWRRNSSSPAAHSRESGKCQSGSPAFAGATGHNALPPAHPPRLPAEHRALAGDAPVIAGEIAGFADDAVAGHDEAHRILADRGADGAGGGGRADFPGDAGIGRERPIGISNSAPRRGLPNRCRSAPRAAAARGFHCDGSKIRCAHRRGARGVFDILAFGQRLFMSSSVACSSPGSAKARPARPRSVAMTSALPNGDG